ncbi:MAG: alpha/beta hydrolase, partial [Chitinophagaceae bacterium]
MSKKTKNKLKKRILIVLIAGFVLMNIVAMFHAYKFTHFTDKAVTRTADPAKLNFGEKIKTLMFGVDNPRPINLIKPKQPFEMVMLKGDPEIQQGDKKIECWYIPHKDSKGTVIVYHGFSGHKSLMLDKLDAFFNMGYNVLMVDFMGSGDSAGNQTTIGY